MYTTGTETAPVYDETSNCKAAGCVWSVFQNCKPAFVPSIVDDTQYSAVETYFKNNYNIVTNGYIQWKQ